MHTFHNLQNSKKAIGLFVPPTGQKGEAIQLKQWKYRSWAADGPPVRQVSGPKPMYCFPCQLDRIKISYFRKYRDFFGGRWWRDVSEGWGDGERWGLIISKLKALQEQSSASVVGSSPLPPAIKWKSKKAMTFVNRQNRRDICDQKWPNKWSINDQN